MSKNGRQGYDWDSIRQEYITTNISTKQLAAKLKIRYGTIADKCRGEGWVKQREEYRQKLSARVVEKAVEKYAEMQSDILSVLHHNTMMVAERCRELLEQEPKSTALMNIMTTIKMAEEVTRSIENKPTQVMAHKMHVELERLKMDQQKAEAFNPENEVVIRIDGFEEEWAE